MINIDILRPYISNKVYRTIAYLFLIPLVLSIIVAFSPFVLGIGIIYLAFKKINNEKIKWTFIAVVTIVLLILGTFNKNEYGKENVLENHQKSINNHDQKREATKEEKWEQKDQKNETNEEIFLVTRIVDGDTIEIEGGRKVRYIGIDTPETVDPIRPAGCYGKEASLKNSELVLNKKVKLVKDVSETDKYGRLLRYVYVENTFVNDYLVSEGYAKASTYTPDVKFSEQFLNSERKAREEKKGLWGDTCEIKTQSPIVTPTPTPSTSIVPTLAIGGEVSVVQKPSSTYEVSSSGVVKKSSTGICHAPGTTYYNKTKNFVAYNSVQACLDSGGRLPLR